MSNRRRRLTGAQIVLLAAAAAYTSVALADDVSAPAPTPTQPQAAPEINDQNQTIHPQVGPAPQANTQERTSEPILDKPEPIHPTATRKEITRSTMDKPLIETYLRTWPEHAGKAAKATIAAYGLPNEATPTMLIWIENGPWLRTIVFKDEVVHDFPRTHYDVIENVIQMKVPLAKVNDVLSFEGSAVVKRTEGLVAVRGYSEAMNYLAINLINDIVTGKKTSAQARKVYARGVVGIAKAEPPVAATKLMFTPEDERAQDPDKPMLKGEYAEPGEKINETAAPPAPPLPSPNDLREPGAPAKTPGSKPGQKANDLNKPAAPAPAAPPMPKAVPGSKNGPTGGARR